MQIIETNFNWKSGLSKRKSTEVIILHHAEASKCSVEDINSWHIDNNLRDYRFIQFIGNDGEYNED